MELAPVLAGAAGALLLLRLLLAVINFIQRRRRTHIRTMVVLGSGRLCRVRRGLRCSSDGLATQGYRSAAHCCPKMGALQLQHQLPPARPARPCACPELYRLTSLHAIACVQPLGPSCTGAITDACIAEPAPMAYQSHPRVAHTTSCCCPPLTTSRCPGAFLSLPSSSSLLHSTLVS